MNFESVSVNSKVHQPTALTNEKNHPDMLKRPGKN